MSIQLDFRTLSLTLMLFSIVFGLGMFAYAREHAKFAGIKTIGTGYFLIGGGCVLLGLRHFIHDFASVVLSNLAIIIGVILIYQGLFRFLGITLRFERWLSPAKWSSADHTVRAARSPSSCAIWITLRK